MKVLASLALASLCGFASAAPLSSGSIEQPDLETAGVRHGTAEVVVVDCPPPGGEAPIPEPASLALLGLGLGAVALRRRK